MSPQGRRQSEARTNGRWAPRARPRVRAREWVDALELPADQVDGVLVGALQRRPFRAMWDDSAIRALRERLIERLGDEGRVW